jgi:hypothetical protein
MKRDGKLPDIRLSQVVRRKLWHGKSGLMKNFASAVDYVSTTFRMFSATMLPERQSVSMRQVQRRKRSSGMP